MVIKPNSTTAVSQVNVADRDIIVLILEFLESKNLNISQVTLERETGMVNGSFCEEVLFLRNLILEGLWDDAVDYVEPLTQAPHFDYSFFKKILHKYKYLELLCIKNEIGNTKFSDHAALSCLRDLEAVCDKAEFNEYRLLLSYPMIQDHPDYKDWNPTNARVKCFKEIRPMVETVLQVEGATPTETSQSPANRLVHLLIKGLLYETAARLCPQRAKKGSDDLRFSALIPKSSPEPDMALLCWLQIIPVEVFTCQFEEKNLPLNYRKFEKPMLEATWTEIIQQSPIRAKSKKEGAADAASPRVAVNDRMVQSMVEQMDGFRRKNVGSSSARQRVLSQSFHLGGLGQEDPFVSGMFSGSTPRQIPSRSARADLAHLSDSTAGFTRSTLGDALALKESPGEPLSPISEHVGFGEAETESSSPPPTPSPRNRKKQGENASVVAPDQQAAGERSRLDEERKKLQDDWEERNRQRDLLMAQILAPASPAQKTQTAFGNETPGPTFGPRKPADIISPLAYGSGGGSGGGGDDGDGDSRNESSSNSILLSASPSSKNSTINGSAERSAVLDYSPARKETEIPVTVVQSPNTSTTGLVQTSSRNGSSPDSYLSSRLSNASNTYDFRNNIFVGQHDSQQFVPIQIVKDSSAIRCAAFHPSGDYYAVGSNSQVLRICSFPSLDHLRSLRSEQAPVQAPVADQRLAYHKGSVFCMAWNPTGDLIATGSNDKTIKLAGFDMQRQVLTDKNIELRIHHDTIRDVVFMNQPKSTANVMISGAGDGKIIMTDCGPATPIKEFNDHTGAVLSLHTWGGAMFVSGSMDKTCRLWDVRKPSATKIIDAKTGCPDSPVTCVRVDPAGKVLATSHENGELMIWDLRGDRLLQVARPHQKEMRGISISPKSNLLLTASYDKTVVAHNMEGNLFQPLPAVLAASHADKVIQCHFHPHELSFLTTSADKTCVLWAYPQLPQ